jgi:glyoxylase-like metal-dependent hydrolase (beta-lactamase superfamily II)
VWVAQPPERLRFDECNATVIEAGDGLVVVDTFSDPRTARALADTLAGLAGTPVRWIVNTHWHTDHVAGNATIAERFPGAVVVGHAATREDIETRAAAMFDEERASTPGHLAEAREMQRTGKGPDGKPADEVMRGRIDRTVAHYENRLAALEATQLLPPALTFGDTLTLHGGERRVRLVHYPGHTHGDVVVEVPDAGVLVTGDLLDDMPYAGHGSPRALIGTLRAFEAMPFVVQVPGHGRVRRDRDHLRAVRELFEALVAGVDAARGRGRTLEQARAGIDVAAFRKRIAGEDAVHQRNFDAFVRAAIDRAFEEARPGEGG